MRSGAQRGVAERGDALRGGALRDSQHHLLTVSEPYMKGK